MKTPGVLVAVLIGLIVVLVGVILIQESRFNVASAQEAGGVGVTANGVIAVTGLYSSDQSVLYVIDTNREVLMTYACYTKTAGRTSMFQRPFLSFLTGRSYVWDATLVQRKGFHGQMESPTPAAIREEIEKREN